MLTSFYEYNLWFRAKRSRYAASPSSSASLPASATTRLPASTSSRLPTSLPTRYFCKCVGVASYMYWLIGYSFLVYSGICSVPPSTSKWLSFITTTCTVAIANASWVISTDYRDDAAACSHDHHNPAACGTNTRLHYRSNGVFYHHHIFPVLLRLLVDSPLHCC